MIPTAIFSFLSKFKYWKELFIGIIAIWLTLCLIFHIFGYSPTGTKGNSRTVVHKRDTLWLPADTNAILALYGFDTIPTSVVVDEEPIWIPPVTDFTGATNLSDSSALIRVTLLKCNELLEECDSMHRWYTARRTYNDTLENDSIRVTLETVVDGFRIGKPKMNYVWLASSLMIVDSILITDSIYYGGPRRGLYVEGSAGPRMTFQNKLNAINASFGLGYFDKKGWRYGLRAGISTKEDYSVEAVLSKEIYIGK
tara:strand:- start:2938 stop:3699 length:762 start_codon:yes stop_codon:yes gene_type:complete